MVRNYPSSEAEQEDQISDEQRPSRKVLNVLREGGVTHGRVLVLLASSIFLSELLIMIVLEYFEPVSMILSAVLDSTVLLLVLVPVYFFLYRPFWLHRKRAEQEVHYLTRQLIRTGEEERKALARDLHDESGQVLAALQFGIETLKNTITDRTPEVEAQCDRLSMMLTQLVDQLRTVTSRLRPPVLDNIGLVGALRWMCEGFSTRWNLPVDYSVAGTKARLDPEIEITMFRICQEALTNIAKHSRATSAEVQLEFGEEEIFLLIRDNGIGFSYSRKIPREGSRRYGIGLLGMRERTTTLNGEFEIEATPGQGTIIRVVLPVMHAIAGEEERAA